MLVENASAHAETSRWELAERLTSQDKLPETMLYAFFKGVMRNIESRQTKKMDKSLKERAWNNASNAKLKLLKETLAQHVSKIVLSDFNETQIQVMLEEHKQTGAVKTHLLELQILMQLNNDPIVDAVYAKAESITPDWVPEIFECVEKECLKISDIRDIYNGKPTKPNH
jgi:hypothetical protein